VHQPPRICTVKLTIRTKEIEPSEAFPKQHRERKYQPPDLARCPRPGCGFQLSWTPKMRQLGKVEPCP
jgi:hypothetical protein